MADPIIFQDQQDLLWSHEDVWMMEKVKVTRANMSPWHRMNVITSKSVNMACVCVLKHVGMKVSNLFNCHSTSRHMTTWVCNIIIFGTCWAHQLPPLEANNDNLPQVVLLLCSAQCKDWKQTPRMNLLRWKHTNQLIVNWCVGLVVQIPGIPLWSGLIGTQNPKPPIYQLLDRINEYSNDPKIYT